MRKFIIMFAVVLMTGLSLSACTSSLSDKQIKEDILKISEFKSTTIDNEKTTIVKEKEGDIYRVTADATLAFSAYSVQADIVMDYSLINGRWIVSNQNYTVNQVTPKELPNLDMIVSAVDSMIESDQDTLDLFRTFWRLPHNYELLSSVIDADPSKVTMVIRSVMTDGPFSQSAQFTVECLFNRLTGWSYTLKDWVKEVTMDWTGTYDLVLTTDIPGYPSNYLNQFYDVGDRIDDLTIQGRSTKTTKYGFIKTVTETISATFTFRGVDYDLAVVTDGSPERLFIRLINNPDYSFYDDSDLLINFYSSLEMIDGSASSYKLEALCMTGEVTKLP